MPFCEANQTVSKLYCRRRSCDCVCNAGFSGDGETCTDVPECDTNNGGCHADAICTELPGSYSCDCNAGYEGDGQTCSDIPECDTNNGGCHADATCTELPGSRTCECNLGYSGDGTTCTWDRSLLLAAGEYGTSNIKGPLLIGPTGKI